MAGRIRIKAARRCPSGSDGGSWAGSLKAGKRAAPLAALIADRDPLRGAPVDLSLRLAALRDPSAAPGEANRGALARIRTEADRLARLAPGMGGDFDPAEAAALAYPDRIGLRRPGDDPRWLLSCGKGAKMDPADPLAAQRLLVVTDTDGNGISDGDEDYDTDGLTNVFEVTLLDASQQPVYDFTLTDTNGEQHRLSDYQDDAEAVVLIWLYQTYFGRRR